MCGCTFLPEAPAATTGTRRERDMRALLLASACAGALVAAATPAHAQAQAQGRPATTSQPPATSDQPRNDDQATEEQAPGDIIVTAQRRSERLQTAPITASVLSGTDLANQNIVNVDALQFAMPSVTVNNFGQGLEFNVRGIGKAETNSQTLTGVITYRDGVATFPGYFQGEPYYDVARVEVLRGPQGTIAGQNSTGGAVFVTTNDPILGGGAHGYLQGQIGNFSDYGLTGAINLPVGDTFAARVAFYSETRDGFYRITGPGGAPYTSNNGDLREASVRLSFLWRPSSRLSILSKTDFNYLDFGGYPAQPYYTYFPNFPIGSTTPNPTYRDLFNISLNSPEEARDKFLRSSLRIEYDTDGGVVLRSITGYQNGNTRYLADLDGTATGNNTFFDSVSDVAYSQEFNIVSPDNRRFTWLLGAYGQWLKNIFETPYQFIIGVPPGSPFSEYRLDGTNPTRQLAAFGQIGFQVTPHLKIEVGGRYTDSRTTNHVRILQYGTPLTAEQTASSDNFSWKASLGWEIDRNNFIYAYRATGFKPGGLNVPVGLGTPAPFGPETVTSYELGWRSNFAGGRIRTTINGFYNQYKGFQVSIGYPQIPTFGFELNVPETTIIYGGEAEIEGRLGHFRFDAGVSFLHSELGSFFATDPRAASLLPCNPVTGPASASCINLDGHEQTYAPGFTANASVSYDFALGGGTTLTPRVNFGHVEGQWATLFENVQRGDQLPSRDIFGAQLVLAHGPWIVTLYGTNLTDQHYPAALISGNYFAGPPRQFGLRVLRTF
jgi:iron complex outermembrane recepter protein